MAFILSEDGTKILGTGMSGDWQDLDETDPRVVDFRAREAAEVTRAKIADLEAAVTDRRLREAILGLDNGWLAAQNDKMAQLRATL